MPRTDSQKTAVRASPWQSKRQKTNDFDKFFLAMWDFVTIPTGFDRIYTRPASFAVESLISAELITEKMVAAVIQNQLQQEDLPSVAH